MPLTLKNVQDEERSGPVEIVLAFAFGPVSRIMSEVFEERRSGMFCPRKPYFGRIGHGVSNLLLTVKVV
jgi:hypothetical protein